ncbi:hypothetical protein, partial [Vibrio parahaemolyticus]|uniref:hypothetical protein n=1 Tax=Vibrio parahaemolyticus TaxID=670 RepID=UPI001E3CCFD4
IDWSPVQVWEGPPNSRRLVSVVFTNLFLYLTILGQVMGQVSPITHSSLSSSNTNLNTYALPSLQIDN